MENKPQEAGNNLIDIKEEKEEQKVINNPSQTPKKNLRMQKKQIILNFSQKTKKIQKIMKYQKKLNKKWNQEKKKKDKNSHKNKYR